MTQTMRERLIAKLMEETGAYALDETDASYLIEGKYSRTEFGEMIDAILAELREPDETATELGADAANDAREPHTVHEFYATGEMMKVGFTAMIDAVREGK